jgi:hypothetical protein
MSHSIDLFHIQGVCEAEELFTRRKENKRNGVLAEEMACGEEEKRKRNEGRKIEEKERNNSEREERTITGKARQDKTVVFALSLQI